MYKIYLILRTILTLLPNLHFCSLISDLILGAKNLLQLVVTQYIGEPPDTIFVKEEYDFIIIGAGPAGCVLARRLSENPKWNILLIEAGGRENFYTDIAGIAAYQRYTTNDWQYKTIPSPNGKYCASLENGQCNYGRGKVVGGTSTIN